MTDKNELALRKQLETAVATIDEIRDKDLLRSVATTFAGMLEVAAAMRKLRAALSNEVMSDIMALQGKSYGFLTDKDRDGKGYPVEIVREVFMESTLRGYAPYQNEWNIIAGKFYATKSGLERKVREFPGLADLKMTEGVPLMKDGGALVEYHATWTVDGKPDQLDCQRNENAGSDTRIPVKVNSGMGVDAVLGKAKRKMLARIYARLTGSEISVGDDGDAVAMVGVDSPAPTERQLFDKSGLPANEPKGSPRDP